MIINYRLSELAYTGSNITKRLTNYLLLIVIARNYSQNLVGEYSAYLNIVSLLLLITNFGYNEYISIQSKNDLSKQFTLLSFLSFFTLLFILLSSSFFPINNKLLFLLLIIKIFFESSCSLIQLAYFQATNNVVIVTITNYSISLLTTGIIVANVFLKLEINYLVSLIIIASIASSVIAFRYTIFYKVSLRLYFQELILTLKNLKYYGLVALTVPLYMTGPNIIASYIIDKESMAVYQVAFSLSNVILLISLSSIQSTFPEILKVKSDSFKIGKILKQLTIKVLTFNLITFCLSYFLSRWGIEQLLNNKNYVDSSSVLNTLIIANTIQSISSIAAIPLIIFNHQKKKFLIQLELVLLSFLGGWICIYFFKQSGIAFAYIIIYSYGLMRYSNYAYALISNR